VWRRYDIIAAIIWRIIKNRFNNSLTTYEDNFTEWEGVMLQTDITILEQRQKILEKEIDEALSHIPIDDPMIANLKLRILYVKEEIDRLRDEALISYHWALLLPQTFLNHWRFGAYY
jgi:hypothetical protein